MFVGYLALLSDEELRTDYHVFPDDAVILWCEVLQLAIIDLDKPYYKAVTAEWFISNKFEVGSFLWVCLYLDIEPQVVRQKFSSKIYYQFH